MAGPRKWPLAGPVTGEPGDVGFVSKCWWADITVVVLEHGLGNGPALINDYYYALRVARPREGIVLQSF